MLEARLGSCWNEMPPTSDRRLHYGSPILMIARAGIDARLVADAIPTVGLGRNHHDRRGIRIGGRGRANAVHPTAQDNHYFVASHDHHFNSTGHDGHDRDNQHIDDAGRDHHNEHFHLDDPSRDDNHNDGTGHDQYQFDIPHLYVDLQHHRHQHHAAGTWWLGGKHRRLCNVPGR